MTFEPWTTGYVLMNVFQGEKQIARFVEKEDAALAIQAVNNQPVQERLIDELQDFCIGLRFQSAFRSVAIGIATVQLKEQIEKVEKLSQQLDGAHKKMREVMSDA